MVAVFGVWLSIFLFLSLCFSICCVASRPSVTTKQLFDTRLLYSPAFFHIMLTHRRTLPLPLFLLALHRPPPIPTIHHPPLQPRWNTRSPPFSNRMAAAKPSINTTQLTPNHL